jgi:HK97 family phage portal protein
MGFLQNLPTVRGPAIRGGGAWGEDPFHGMYSGYYPPAWGGQMSAAGVPVSPELAMCLTAMYCGTTMIAQDIATMPPHQYRRLDNGGKQRVNRLGLETKLRWQPNEWQTAVEFWSTVVGHMILRGWAPCEIISTPQEVIAQIIPRHPDRVQAKLLPSGRIQYTVSIIGQEPRKVPHDQMFVVRDFSSGAVVPVSRIAYGMNALGNALAAEKFAGAYFKKGITGSLLLSHKGGEMEPAEKTNLHASITQYIAGAENAGGVMLLEEDITVHELGVEPDKAQMMAVRDFGIRECARLLKMPAHKLEAAVLAQAYAAREAANLEYLISCLRPINIEQSIQRDLIFGADKDEYFVEFLMDALFRGDTKARTEYYKAAIQFGWMNRNEVRLRENLNPEPGLDRFLEPLNMTDADEDGRGRRRRREPESEARIDRTQLRLLTFANAAAQRTIRKEVAALAKLAERHSNDAAAWQEGVRAFYEDHAGFVAETMRLPLPVARDYAARHGVTVATQGVKVTEDWEWQEVPNLALLAMEVDQAA